MKKKKLVEKKLNDLGKKLLSELEKGENPAIEIPVRSISNVIYDEKTHSLTLGDKISKRFFFHVAHAKPFMQTLLVAAFTKSLLEENIHTSLRDMFYALKRTLPNSNENTFDEQRESDSVLVDLEVTLDVLREQLHLSADVRGRVVGDVIIEDRGDIIDWSKLGSGGWAIPSNVEDIEFKKLKAKWILVVEKNAAFERLHEDKFWKKHKCILLTTQGQAARGARRLIQRLSTEFDLPVYVFTDSVPEDEIVAVKTKDGIKIERIGKLAEKVMSNRERERVYVDWKVLSLNPFTGRVEWTPIDYLYRHKVKQNILKIKTKGRGIVRVTKGHSLFIWRDDEIKVIKANEIRTGDYLIVVEKLSDSVFSPEYKEITISEKIGNRLNERRKKRILVKRSGVVKTLYEGENEEFEYIAPVESKKFIKNKIKVDEKLAWLLGLYVAEGSVSKGKYIKINLGPKEEALAEKAIEIIKEKFGNIAKIVKKENETVVLISSSLLAKLFESLGLCKNSREKEIPEIVINSPKSVVVSFLKGLFDGDGHIDPYGSIVYSTRSEKLAKQVVHLLVFLGINPTIVLNKKDTIIRISAYRNKKNSLNHINNEPSYGIPVSEKIKKILIYAANNGITSFSIKNKTVSKQKMKVIEELVENRYLKFLINSDLSLVKVISVEEENYEGYVYDFCVSPTQSFVGGNMVLYHNSDPYGWYIYSVIKYGSISLAHISDRLGTPSAKFIGLTISDIDKFGLHQWTIKAKDVDVKRAKEMLKYKWFQHPAWQKELKLMIKRKIKAELEALSGKGLRFVTEKYLPEKIKNQDFLP